MTGSKPKLIVPHVDAAVARGRASYGASFGSAQVRVAQAAAQRFTDRARHVSEAVARAQTPPEARITSHSASPEAFGYRDLKGSGPPPAPKRPIYILKNPEGHCRLQDTGTGQIREAGTLYGAFVRMRANGDVYVSPMSSPVVRGDSHPTIAANSTEGRLGQRVVVAAGEVGIVGNQVVGHNDKTGHFQTRRNRQQSGLPPDKFYPYTVTSKDWYKAEPPESPRN